MCDPISATIGVAALVGGGMSYINGKKQAKAANAANAANERAAAAQAQASETQFNKANQKMPDIAAMFSRNRDAAAGGMPATFLTGPSGAAPGALGKTTLLGG